MKRVHKGQEKRKEALKLVKNYPGKINNLNGEQEKDTRGK